MNQITHLISKSGPTRGKLGAYRAVLNAHLKLMTINL